MSTHELEATFLQLQEMHQRLLYLEKQPKIVKGAVSWFKKVALGNPLPTMRDKLRKIFQESGYLDIVVSYKNNVLRVEIKKKERITHWWKLYQNEQEQWVLETENNKKETVKHRFTTIENAKEHLLEQVNNMYVSKKGTIEKQTKKANNIKRQEARDAKSNVQENNKAAEEEKQEEDPGYHPEFGSRWRTDQFW